MANTGSTSVSGRSWSPSSAQSACISASACTATIIALEAELEASEDVQYEG